MLTQQQVNQINESFKEALSSYNSNAKEKIVDSKSTFATVAQYLRSENVEQIPGWTHVNVWRAAIVAVQDRLEKVPVKTAAEIAHAKDARDRADGSFKNRYRPKSNEPVKGNLEDALNMAQKNLQNMFNPEPEAPEPKSKPFTDLPVSIDVKDFTPEQLSTFRKLSSDQIKAWSKKRAEYIHNERYPQAFKG